MSCRYIFIFISFHFIFSDCLDGLIDNQSYTGPSSSEPECIPELFVFNSSIQLSYIFFEIVLLSGSEIGPDDWIGAFNSDICVGARKWSTCNGEACDVPVLGQDSSGLTDGYMLAGDIPTFKIFQASSQNYYPAYHTSTDVVWTFFGTPLVSVLESCANSHDWDSDGICDNLDNCIGTEDNLGNCLNIEEPLSFSLEQNYPNPFNPYTIIEFNLEKNNFVQLNIFDLSGKKVKNLINNFLMNGNYQITWDGLDYNSIKLPSATYIVSLSTEKEILSKKMTIIK